MPNHRNTADRFWAKVDRSGGPDACWPWLAGKTHFGHGRTKFGGIEMRAHRKAWELMHGPIPDGQCALHNCPSGDNPACCNPAHLFLGTKGDNNRDRNAKGREAHQVGSTHGMSKLTEDQVREMRRLRAAGWRLTSLAEEFGVNFQNVSLIVNRKAWQHVD